MLRRKELKMSHALPSKPFVFEELSNEEQIVYIETHLDELVAELRANPELEPWDAEMLAERLARHRAECEGGVDWEDFKKEFMKD
jgi:hypothetical protein